MVRAHLMHKMALSEAPDTFVVRQEEHPDRSLLRHQLWEKQAVSSGSRTTAD